MAAKTFWISGSIYKSVLDNILDDFNYDDLYKMKLFCAIVSESLFILSILFIVQKIVLFLTHANS